MMKKQLTTLTAALLVAMSATAVIGCSDDTNPINSSTAPTLDIVETAAAAGNFKTLLAAAELAGLVDALKGDGPLTVFAPTDDAFAALPDGTVEALLGDSAKLASILKYHVVKGKVTASTVVTLDETATLNGQKAMITVTEEGTVKIDAATVIKTDIEATNGVIHVIDAVILPGSSMSATTNREQIQGSLATAQLAGVRMSDASVRKADGQIPIYPLANKAGLKTLAAAIRAAGLQQTLTVDGPFTVFAPTEEAFSALPEGALEDLLNDTDALKNVLLYHVVSGTVKAETVVGLTEATMLNTEKVTITVGDDGVMVNDANVIQTDIMAKNGVVHLIDKVLLP